MVVGELEIRHAQIEAPCLQARDGVSRRRRRDRLVTERLHEAHEPSMNRRIIVDEKDLLRH